MFRFKPSLIITVFTLLVMSIPLSSFAQDKKVRPSLHAQVSQRIGVDTDLTFDFSRPGVKGRTIWGDLVPWGMAEGNKYSNNKPYPWRAGANENTTFETTGDILVEGQKLAKGKYGIHMIPGESEWVVIFSKKNDIWGSYEYDQKNDALRVTVKPKAAAHEEWLTFGFDDLAGTSATAYLHWEKLMVPFKVQVAE